MAIGRVVSVHFYSYAPWRAYGLKMELMFHMVINAWLRPMEGVWIENCIAIPDSFLIRRYAPWRGVWIENDCYCFLFMERKATPHGGAYGLKSKVSSRSLYSVLLRPMEGRMD